MSFVFNPHHGLIVVGAELYGPSGSIVPRLGVERLSSLGRHRADLAILAHTLPPSAGIDGLLGLDFLRGQQLSINFREGTVTLQ